MCVLKDENGMANKGRFFNLDFLCILLAFFSAFFSAVSLPIT